MGEYKLQNLREGDIVEFPKNDPPARYGVVIGGFGMSTTTIGSKIFGNFGATPQEAIDNFHADTNGGFTRTQECAVVGHIEPKRDIKKISSDYVRRRLEEAKKQLEEAKAEVGKWEQIEP